MGRKPKVRRNSYGAWLLYLRNECGLTQAEVAQKTRIPRTTLMHWERTGKLAGRDEILRLARVYKVPVEELLRSRRKTKP